MVREPPRHGKSEHLCHWTPAWYMGNWPEREVIVCGHGGRFARKFGRRSRNTFGDVAPHVWGVDLDPDRQAADNWGTTDGGGVITAGIGGGIGGEGASLLIVDDLIKDAKKASSETFRDDCWDWFVSVAWPRLSPVGVCIVIGTSWHRDDYQQRIKREFPDEVLDICLPAIAEENDLLGRAEGESLWPERWDNDWLEKQRLILGNYYWSSLYQQRPTLHDEAEWPAEYFEGIDVDQWPERFDISLVIVDASEGKKKGDFGAVLFLGWTKGRVYVDADIERRPVPELMHAVNRMSREHFPNVICFEGNQFQKLLVGEYERYTRDHDMYSCPVGYVENFAIKKEVRIRRLGAWLSRKMLRFRRGRTGIERLIDQMKDFPLGDHDDGPDALEMGLRKLNELAAGAFGGNENGGENHESEYEAETVYQ